MKTKSKLEELSAKYTFTSDKFSAMAGQELRREIQDVVFKLAIGEITDPIKIDAQYFIFRLDSIVSSQQLSLVEAQDKTKGFLYEKKMQEELAKWLDEIKKQYTREKTKNIIDPIWIGIRCSSYCGRAQVYLGWSPHTIKDWAAWTF